MTENRVVLPGGNIRAANNTTEGDHVHAWALIGRAYIEFGAEWQGEFQPMNFVITYVCGDVERPGWLFQVKNYVHTARECRKAGWPEGTVCHRRFIMRLMHRYNGRGKPKRLTPWSDHFAYWDVWHVHKKLVESVK